MIPKLAILGGPKSVQLPPPRWPRPQELEVAWMEGVVRSGVWAWNGPHEMQFAREFAEFIGARKALCVANGTVSLEVGLLAAGVKPGDEVIIPALTWVATFQAALSIGACPVLVDIDPETYCIDPVAAEKAVTARTTAIMPVHLYASMADMDAVREIAERHNLAVIEDVAHQHGSQWRGKGAGAIGDVGSFSFQSSKVLTCGEGGAVTTNSDEIWECCFNLKHVGWKSDLSGEAGKYGHNYRVTEMQAVLLRGGLRRIAEETYIREKNVAYLANKLEELGGPLRATKRDHRVTRQAYYCMSFHYDRSKLGGVSKDVFLKALQAEGVGFTSTYEPVYRAKILNLKDPTSPVAFRPGETLPQDYDSLRLPVTERVVEEEGVVLLHHWLLGSKEVLDQIIEAVGKVSSNETEVLQLAESQAR